MTLDDKVIDLAPLEACRLWEGGMMQLESKYGKLTYRRLQEYRNGLLRCWNDKEAPPTKLEKQLFNACYDVLKAAGLD